MNRRKKETWWKKVPRLIPDQSEDARTETLDIRNRRMMGARWKNMQITKKKGKSFVKPTEMENVDHYS
jgi:hypothetical protein